jgi:uncharacterized protein
MEATAISTQPEKVQSTSVSPTPANDRILFLDSVRGLALLGILLMNIMAQSQSHYYYAALNPDQSITGPNFWAWIIECMFFEGTMRGLFSILFGAGTLLFLAHLVKQKQGLEPADIYYRRMLWLLVFGLINAFVFLWPGDILYPYALCGLLLFPFRNWSVRNLLLGAVFFLAIGTYRENSMLQDAKLLIAEGRAAEAVQAEKATLTEKQTEALEKWKGFKEKNTTEGIAKEAKKETAKIQGQSYASIFSFYKDINMMIQGSFFYKSGWWDVLLFFFIGMALFKSGFILGKAPTALYAGLAVVGIGVGLALNYFLLKLQYQIRFDNVIFSERWKFSYYEIRRVFLTIGYLSFLILLYKASAGKKLLHFFAPVGKMAFTNYLMQSIITSVIFLGFGLFGKLQRYETYFILVNIWIFQIAFSHIWLHFFRFGPFEWVWRCLTYWQKPPMRKRKEETLATVPAA